MPVIDSLVNRGRRQKTAHRQPRRRVGVASWCFGASALMVVGVVGCKVGPDYHPPKQPMPKEWELHPTTQASVPVARPVELEHWWTTFDDPTLNSLVRRALDQNLDLKAATERVRESRA